MAANVAIVSLVAAGAVLWAVVVAKTRSLRASDARRIEAKIDALQRLLAEYGGGNSIAPETAPTIGGGFTGSTEPEFERGITRSDLGRIERKLDTIVKGLGFENAMWPPISGEVRRLWEEREKIAAIRRYREENPGLGLKEAKDVLDWTLGKSL